MRFICVYIELQWLLLPRFYRIGEIIAIWPALGWFQGPYMGNADTFSCLRYNWHWRYPSQKLFVKELRSASLQLIHDYPQVLRHLPVAYLQICFCYSNMTTALGKCSLHHCQPLPPQNNNNNNQRSKKKIQPTSDWYRKSRRFRSSIHWNLQRKKTPSRQALVATWAASSALILLHVSAEDFAAPRDVPKEWKMKGGITWEVWVDKKIKSSKLKTKKNSTPHG